MKKLHKTFFGLTIDLSKIASIGNAYLKSRGARRSSIWVCFNIMFDGGKEYNFKRKMEEGEFKTITKYQQCGHTNWTYMADVDYMKIKFEDKYRYIPKAMKADKGKCLAIQNLQKQVDELIKVWGEYNNE